MEKKELKSLVEEARENLGAYIKDEAKRRFIGETYPYLIKIPNLVFAIVSLISTFIILAVELLLAGIILRDHVVKYDHLLIGFVSAVIVGALIGKIFSEKSARRVHSQIGEVLKFKKHAKAKG